MQGLHNVLDRLKVRRGEAKLYSAASASGFHPPPGTPHKPRTRTHKESTNHVKLASPQHIGTRNRGSHKQVQKHGGVLYALIFQPAQSIHVAEGHLAKEFWNFRFLLPNTLPIVHPAARCLLRLFLPQRKLRRQDDQSPRFDVQDAGSVVDTHSQDQTLAFIAAEIHGHHARVQVGPRR